MKLNNIKSVIKNDWRILRRVKYRVIEITYFPLTSILIWGLFAVYSKRYALEAGLIVLVVNLFWSFSHLAQQQANILVMEDLWSLSLKHILIAGVTEFEYLLAKLFTSTLAAISVGTILFIVANAFGAALFANLSTVLIVFFIALIASLALAVAIAGAVIMLGREYGFLSWSTLQLFIFFSAPFYSPDVLPAAIRWITEFMPFTYVFEAARKIATNSVITSSLLWHAFFIAIAYFILAWPFYAWAFRRARKTGIMARMAR